jgi:6-pyruvoyltetrahydropterin/6-carboxytetrahydropterin synthase
VVDHSFIVYEKDYLAIQALEVLGNDHRTLIVPFIPTAENLAKWAFEQVEPHIESKYGQNIKLLAMNVRETPKSWASWKKN